MLRSLFCAFGIAALLAACGGGSSGSPSSSSTTDGSGAVVGIATPSSVSVVSATE